MTGGGALNLNTPAISLSSAGLTIQNSSDVNSNVTGALGTTTEVTISDTASVFNAGATQQVSSINSQGIVRLATGATLTVGNTVDNLSSNSNGIVEGSGVLAKDGTGVFTLATPNAYGPASPAAVGTIVKAGTLVSSTTGSLGTRAVQLTGGTLRVAGTPGPSTVVSGFNGGSGWTVNSSGNNSTPFPSANDLLLTDSNNNEARSAWFNSQVPYASGSAGFAASFTYTPSNGSSPRADGITFVLQNSTNGTSALGPPGGALGYSTNDQYSGIATIAPSIAYEINIFNGHNIGTNLVTSSTTPATLVFNKVDGTQPGGVNVNSGDPINVTLTYDPIGHTITENLSDATTSATYGPVVYSNISLPEILDSPVAFIGFTGATGGLNAQQDITNFSYQVTPNTGTDVYSNNVVLSGGANATIDVAVTTPGETIAMGDLSVGSGAGTTLNVISSTAPGDFTLQLGNTSLAGNVTFNVANPASGNGTLILSSLNDGGVARTITKENAGALEIQGSPTLSNNTPFVVNAGTMRFNNNVGPATIGTGVNVHVNGSSVLELAGTQPSLSDATLPGDRAHIINNSTSATGILVSGQNQQVGAIDGTGTTHVDDGSDLTADHIIQGALVIGDTGASPSIVSIAASDANGNPMAGGLAIAGSLAPAQR